MQQQKQEQQQQKQDLAILCDILQLIIDSYQHHTYLPDWLYQHWHPHQKRSNQLKQKIEAIKNSVLEVETVSKKQPIAQIEDKLIKLLDEQRYWMSVYTSSQRLHTKIQDALLETLFFKHTHIEKYKQLVLAEKNIPAFLAFIDRTEEINTYKKYYKQHHAIHGRYMSRLNEEEISSAAKASMISGKLVERYGIKKNIAYGLHYIRNELTDLRKRDIEENYLTTPAITGYLEKLDFLLHPANEIQQDEAALIQNARYLLEDIINAAGVDEQGKAQHSTHQILVNACYWVEDMFKVARGRVDAENII